MREQIELSNEAASALSGSADAVLRGLAALAAPTTLATLPALLARSLLHGESEGAERDGGEREGGSHVHDAGSVIRA